ncbi:LRR receptor-like kinase family protein [Medicago truncatula]|uniref:LRR receptor-like kinase family protein n=1 Tax=Medicago truncatula TaxID=3880 RepID=G7JP59_MEDTR|nr:LRR receptor-like kinase family protein [Medicago truncatula]
MKLGLIISSLFYFMTLMLIQNEGCNGCVENERMGLLEIKKYIVSQVEYYNKELSSWVDDRDHSNCCSWKRVKCSNFSSGHITKLSIQGLLFATPHPNMLNISLFRPFEELRLLDLSLNGFRGWIGNKGFPRLKKLETLDLTNNNLKGSILSSLNGLTALKTLKLSYNSIYNNYPTQGFPRLKKLETLDLSWNGIESSILPSLNGLAALKTLNLSYNSMRNFSPQGMFVFYNLFTTLSVDGNFVCLVVVLMSYITHGFNVYFQNCTD